MPEGALISCSAGKRNLRPVPYWWYHSPLRVLQKAPIFALWPPQKICNAWRTGHVSWRDQSAEQDGAEIWALMARVPPLPCVREQRSGRLACEHL